MKKNTKIFIGAGILIIIIFLILIMNLIKNIKSISTIKQEDYVIENEYKSGGKEYSPEQLKNLQIKITDMPKEVKEKINDEEKLITSVKEYMFFNGLVDANVAKCDNYKIDEEKKQIKMRFILNNDAKDILLAIIDLNSNEIKITNY